MRTTLRRFLLSVFIVLLALGLFVGYKAYSIYRDVSKVTGVIYPRLSPTVEPIATLPPFNGNNPFTVLVLGSDNDKKKQEVHPLTQSMIVVRVYPAQHSVRLLSIPRDFWVPIYKHGYGKIDLAAKYGWIPLARATVEKLFGIHIDYYAWVGLNGFRQVVDSFNGINLDISRPILDDYYPDDQRAGNPYGFIRLLIPPGWRHLSGRQALEYVRSRHADPIGDFGRSERQQQILLALRHKATGFSVLTKIPDLADALQNVVQTDFSVGQLFQLEKLSRGITTNSIQRLILQAPTYCRYGFVNGQSVLFPNWAVIRPAVHSLFFPSAPTKAPAAHTSPPAPRPSPNHLSGTAVKPSATPTPAPTPVTPALNQLPGTLIFEREGNIFQLSPTRQLKEVSVYGGHALNASAMPGVSPDGRSVAFLRFSSYATDVWVINRHTGQLRQLTSDTNIRNVHDNLWAIWPSWSTDGKTVIYSSDQQKLKFPPSESRSVDLAIWARPATGGAAVQLTSSSNTLGAGGDTDPMWRPHANQFMYVHWSYNKNNQPVSQLIVRDVADQKSWPLTAANGRVLQPILSADGSLITFVQGSGSSSQIVVAPLLGGTGTPHLGPLRVLAGGEVAQPAIAPGKKWVSYLQADGDDFVLEMVPITGGSPVRIDEAGPNLDAISRPVWTSH
ncbi:MAG: LCP family protein [Chloroflexota bacterium]